MKKLLSVLLIFAVFAGIVPMAMASSTEVIDSIIVENDGTAAVNGSEEYIEGYARTEVSVYGEMGTPDAGDDSYYYHSWSGEQAHSFRYYPKLNAGKYKVYVYVPNKAYQVRVTAYGSDGTSAEMANTSVKSAVDGGKSGPGDFVEYGIFEFTGVYGEDYIELKEALVNSHSGNSYNSGWKVYYDTVKFVSYSEVPEITLPDTIGNVEELILEEDGLALVNNAAEYVSNYGATSVVGTIKGTVTGTTYSNSKAYEFAGANSQSCWVKYYPVLNPGEYVVYYYRPTGTYKSGLTISGSNIQTKLFGHNGSTSVTSQFIEVGVFTATGVYGEDYIKITDRTESGVGSGYEQVCDAVKFVKVGAPKIDVPENIGTVDSLLLEENGQALVNDSTEYVTNYGATSVIGSVTTTTGGHNNSRYHHLYTGGTKENTIKYYPVLEAGEYKVSVYYSTDAYQVGLRAEGSDGQVLTNATSAMDGGNAGPGSFLELGTFTFTGVYGDDYIELYERIQEDNVHSWADYATGHWHVYFDAILFEKPGEPEPVIPEIELPETVGDVQQLIIEENGQALVNDSTEYVSNYGSAKCETNGTVTVVTDDGTKYHGGRAIYVEGGYTNSKANTYYPVVNAGKYKVYYLKPINTYQTYISVTGSDGMYTQHHYTGEPAPSAKTWVESGVFTATGVYGNDWIKLSDIPNKTEMNSGWRTFFDAVKLVKIDCDMSIEDANIDTESKVYTANVLNFNYDTAKTLDAVVAVYGSTGIMKDVYVQTGIDVPDSGQSVTVTTDALDYEEGDTVRIFILDSFGTMKPLKVYR